MSGSTIKPSLEIIKRASLIGMEQGTCNRLRVGAIVWCHAAGKFRIISSGANSSPLGNDFTCDKDGHLLLENHCIRTIHAEMKAIVRAVKKLPIYAIKNCCVHVSHTPCPHCIKMSMEFGFRQITWEEDYPNAIGTHKILIETNFPWGIYTRNDY